MTKTLVTHSGTFHADDVFAVATFLLAHPEDKWSIVRSRDREVINNADAVIDVGDVYDPKTKRFDHHQTEGAGVRENKIPFAAFGLVWKEYGSVVCGGDFFIADQMESGIVVALDANDNGVKLYDELFEVAPFELSQYIKIQNLTWKEEENLGDKKDQESLKRFLSLVDFASGIIQRQIIRYRDKNEAFQFVKAAYENASDKRIIILPNFYPWKDVLIDYPEPLIVISPRDGGSKWTAEVVPKERNSFESRVKFPLEWAGKRDEDLAKVTGVEDAVFCHNKLFLTVAQSKGGALALAKLALK